MLAKHSLKILAPLILSAESDKQQKKCLKVSPGAWLNGFQQIFSMLFQAMITLKAHQWLASKVTNLRSGRSSLIYHNSLILCSKNTQTQMRRMMFGRS